MKLDYKLVIDEPHKHQVKIKISGKRDPKSNKLSFFLPSWSPGSYLMREYGRHVSKFSATNSKGETLFHDQVAKGIWEVDWSKSDLKNDLEKFIIEYQVYCHELTVRTSHVTEEHAFLHGPTLFMGIKNQEIFKPTLTLEFPGLWSKVSTGLKDISEKREIFKYSAENYDVLIDAPIEIGCHETDGFRVEGKDHYLAFFGNTLPHKQNLKEDIKTIVEHIASFMGDIPYESYHFITHFVPGLYGGLEHLNSTALQFDALKLGDRKSYTNWLSLVAHEYFHTWNVKRIRPRALGPFDYTEENYTKMLWLAEGLTVFMDELFVFRCGLMTMEEYLENMKTYINRYFQIQGRRFDSLEGSSFNAWVKLYRPDENSANSTISYYLKGGLAFYQLNVLLNENGKSINDLIHKLWDAYKARPELGVTEEEVFQMIEDLSSKEVREKFEVMIKTTEDYDLEDYSNRMGLKFIYSEKQNPWIGITPEFRGEQIFVKSVDLDSPGHRAGINAGDELIALNGLRLTKTTHADLDKVLIPDSQYTFTISRLQQLRDVAVIVGKSPKSIEKIEVSDVNLAKSVLLGSVNS